MPSLWCHADRHCRDDGAALYYVSAEVLILAQVNDAYPACEDGRSAKGDGGDMGGCIVVACHPRDGDISRSNKLRSQCAGKQRLLVDASRLLTMTMAG